MDIPQKIKTAATTAGMNMSKLAEALGTSKSAFHQRLATGKFTGAELERIAEALGAELTIKFTFPDGTEI